MNDTAHRNARLLASYGRRKGRRLRPNKQQLVQQLLPELEITLPNAGTLDLKTLFPQRSEYWLEIGFGGGEHMAHQAEQRSDIGIIGCEPYLNGIAGLLASIQAKNLNNIRIYPHDSRHLLALLPAHCLKKVFILYPDPWPKLRHRKRRLVTTTLLDALSRVMLHDAELQIVTDDADYCSWILEQILAHPAFCWTAQTCKDWQKPPVDWYSTRYEQKALQAGRAPTYLLFTKI